MTLEFHYLPADLLGLEDWARVALAERPRPAGLCGAIVPGDLASFPRPERVFDADQRADLASALEDRLARFEPHVAVLEAVRALRAGGAALVLAGQQPALLGGPLYNLYKALHAVVLARALEARWGTPLIPAFWNHADDHDLAEVHHLWIQNQNLDLSKIGLAGVSSGKLMLGRLRFEEERHHLRAIEELLRQNLQVGPELDAALELFVPRDGETFASAFTRVLAGLFGHLGLVVVEPDWIREPLSRALAHIVTSDLSGALASGARAVELGGGGPPIDPADAALFFRIVDGRRHALRFAGDDFRFDGESGSRTAAELAAEIVQDPLEWSPGALVRPIAQDLVLPVAAYVGGWGELSYHAELVPLRRAAGAPNTPFVPRLSATLVDPSARASLAKVGLDVQDVLLARGALGEPADAGPSSPLVPRLRGIGERAAHELLALKDEVAAVDRGLAQQLKKSADQLEGVLEKLAAKIERVQANASGSERRHLRRLSNGLFPRGEPQERVRGALEFVARFGRGWLDELLHEIDPLPTEHVVVHLAGAMIEREESA